eukprot:4450628-Pleurochrysis_carterae.AAC.5
MQDALGDIGKMATRLLEQEINSLDEHLRGRDLKCAAAGGSARRSWRRVRRRRVAVGIDVAPCHHLFALPACFVAEEGVAPFGETAPETQARAVWA